ncbi:MAG: hypothetical protein ACYDBQ_02680 [Thermoplasmatota archaeon]
MAALTSIKVNTTTRDHLQSLKGRYTYDELMEMLMRLVPEGDEDGKFRPEFRLKLLEGKLYRGPYISHEAMMREFAR